MGDDMGDEQDHESVWTVRPPCPDCRGTGRVALLIRMVSCAACGGTGAVTPAALEDEEAFMICKTDDDDDDDETLHIVLDLSDPATAGVTSADDGGPPGIVSVWFADGDGGLTYLKDIDLAAPDDGTPA